MILFADSVFFAKILIYKQAIERWKFSRSFKEKKLSAREAHDLGKLAYTAAFEDDL